MDCLTPSRPESPRRATLALAPVGTRPAYDDGAAQAKTSPDAHRGPGASNAREADAVMSIDERRIVSVRPGRGGLNVECVCGHVWVTQEGCGNDVILPPGHTFTTDEFGKVVVQAYAPALVRIIRR